jgi:AmmeMemoRadiSam system protein B
VSQRVRQSVIAGQWYPGNARQLERMINGFFENVVHADLEGRLIGLISPHAGYMYSGQTAAYAYDQTRGKSFDVVVVISPVHRMPVGRFAITSADAYETPLGQVMLDSEMVDELGKHVSIDRVGFDGEHSLEIQLPFLQVAMGSFRLLPVMVGVSSFEAAAELGAALAKVLDGRNALVVASTDMHHIDRYEEVVRRDAIVIDAIASFDMERIKEALSPWDCSVCGRIPVYAMLTAAKQLGADRVQILHHTNSGDVTGDRNPPHYIVGYMAAAVYKKQ